VEGIGVSVPGRFDLVSDRLVFAPNLKWSNVDLRKPIAKATRLEVEIENAANAFPESGGDYGVGRNRVRHTDQR
jgi:predicted NBD/HSP70 family sugar kinase